MIELRWRSVKDPGSTIRPPFDLCPSATTARSISPALLTLTGLSSHAQRRGGGLHDGELTYSGYQGGIAKDCRSRDPWCDFLEQLQPFRANTELEWGESGHVTAR